MGFDIDRFVDSVNEELLCPICNDVLEEKVSYRFREMRRLIQ